MTWETVYDATLEVDPATEPITLPHTFQPYYRLIVTAELLTGLGVREPFLGYLRQLLIVPGIGEVKGRTLALSPLQQLFIPSTELPYKLVYQPVQRDFSLKLTIQVESTIVSSGGTADNGPVLTAIAAVQTRLDNWTDSGEATDYAPSFAQILTVLDALGDGVLAVSHQLATVIAVQTDIDAALASLQATDAALTTKVDDILELVTPPPPSPTPTPTPTPAPSVPSAAGVAYVASQSNDFSSSYVGTYANLTDGSKTTGAACGGGDGLWIQATFPQAVQVASVTVHAPQFSGVPGSASLINGRKLQYSANDADWTDVLTIDGVPNEQAKTFTFGAPITARYWRVLGAYYTATAEFVFT